MEIIQGILKFIGSLIEVLSANQNNPITWIVAIALVYVAIKVVNKIVKTVSSISFLLFMFVKLFGANTLLAFFK
jgi:hypothetical protein